MSVSKNPLDVQRAIRDGGTTRNAQRILIWALVQRADKDGICWPGYQQLSEDTCLDQGTLKRAAKALEDMGLILREVCPNTSNRWHLQYARYTDKPKRAKQPTTKRRRSAWSG